MATFASNMKKAFFIFLSILYLVLSSGFTTINHFCKGVKQQTSFFADTKPKNGCPICAEKKQQKSKDCCKHKAQQHKISEKVKQPTLTDLIQKFTWAVLPAEFYKTIFSVYFPEVNKPDTPVFAFIPIRNNPLYIFYCVYRI